jgi:hypothetical protein
LVTRLVVTEYPKSGATWLVSMLGDALGWPKRDIYVRPGFSLFDVRKVPWYRDCPVPDCPDPCVIKSHELPGSALVDFPATYIHLYRDGRDVAVSKYFFEKDFLVKNEITPAFDKTFAQFLEETARSWAQYVRAWSSEPVIAISYEALLRNPLQELARLLRELNASPGSRAVAGAVEANTPRKLAASLSGFRHNTFVRKATAGDWKNHFSAEDLRVFDALAGRELAMLGYPLR